MICTSFGNIAFDQLMVELQQSEMAEIRIDLLDLSDKEIAEVFGNHSNLIATCRPDSVGITEQKRVLTLAINSGAALVDIELEAAESLKKEMIAVAKAKGCRVIISYHNYEQTPSTQILQEIVNQIFAKGADIAKIATMTNSAADAARIMGLYENNRSLVALAMGENGIISRVAATLLGAPFTFAAPNGKATAPGQLDVNAMKTIYKTISHNE